MSRRLFVGGGTATALLAGCTHAPVRTVVRDGFSMWYNRPTCVSLGRDAYAVSSVSSQGEARISPFDRSAETGTISLAKFERISDHGTPAIIRVGNKIEYAVANHSSPLYVGTIDETSWNSLSPAVGAPLEEGRCTYPSLLWFNGELLLFYTLLFIDSDGMTYREYVIRRSLDGGATWSEKTFCIPGTEKNPLSGSTFCDGGRATLDSLLYGHPSRRAGYFDRRHLSDVQP